MREDPDEILGIAHGASLAQPGFVCPICGGVLQRGSSTTAGLTGGMVGGLLYAAFASLECPKCGKVPSKMLPRDIRHEHWVVSFFLAACAAVLLIVVMLLAGPIGGR